MKPIKPKINLTIEQMIQIFKDVDAMKTKPRIRKIKSKPPQGTLTWKFLQNR